MRFHRGHRVAHAALSQVYLFEDPEGQAYVLRGQPATVENIARLGRAAEMTAHVRGLIGIELPRFVLSAGKPFSVFGDFVWNLYPLIEGGVLCSWQDCHRATLPDAERAAAALRSVHDRTRGIFSETEFGYFTDDIREKFEVVKPILSPAARRRCTLALDAVESASGAAVCCFVHGDFHHGNVIVKDGRVRGFVDMDWCRLAHPYEDLAFFAMMTARDYTAGHYEYNSQLIGRTLAAYGLPAGDSELFSHYFVLCALHDVHVFLAMIPKPDYLSYQIQMLEHICALNHARESGAPRH